MAVRVELGDFALARDLAAEYAAQARGRDRLAALWQLQAVPGDGGLRPGTLFAVTMPPAAGGGMFLFGRRCSTLKQTYCVPFIVRLDASGAPLWDQVLPDLPNYSLTRLLETADGGVIVQARSASYQQTWLRRYDGLGPSTCDDGDACTLDTCLAQTCSHLALPDGTACGGASKCAMGTCKP